jgi:short subunit dehydrogenase-like uncharacterized protein
MERNTRIVHRSNALAHHAYGVTPLYDEAYRWGRSRLAASGLAAATVCRRRDPAGARSSLCYLARRGPSAPEQRSSDPRLQTADGREIRTRVTGDRDPGYGSTAKMLGQAGAYLALEVPRAKTPGGFWTPATIFGDGLIERLTAHSGLTFEVVA